MDSCRNYDVLRSMTEHKQAIRGHVAYRFSQMPRRSVILTFPGPYFFTEKALLLKRPDLQFICLERDRQTFDIGLENLPGMNRYRINYLQWKTSSVHYIKRDFDQYMKTVNHNVHCSWLDFFGGYTNDRMLGIQKLWASTEHTMFLTLSSRTPDSKAAKEIKDIGMENFYSKKLPNSKIVDYTKYGPKFGKGHTMHHIELKKI